MSQFVKKAVYLLMEAPLHLDFYVYVGNCSMIKMKNLNFGNLGEEKIDYVN